MRFPAEYAVWLEAIGVLSCAVIGLVVAARLAERWLTSAAHRRVVWQTASAAILLILALELSGAAKTVAPWLRRPEVSTASSSRALQLSEHEARSSQPVRPTDELWASTTTSRTDASSSRVHTGELPAVTDVDITALEAETLSLSSDDSPATTASVSGEAAWQIPLGPVEGDAVPRPSGPKVEEDAEEATLPGKSRALPETTSRSFIERTRATSEEPQPPVSPATWPLWVWLAGTAILSLYQLAAHIVAPLRYAKARSIADPALRQRLEQWAIQLDFQRTVRLIESPRQKTPAAFGILRPTIVVPSRFARDFAVEEQDAILVHELAHLAAGDQLWNLAVNLLTALMWWQPAVWFLRRRFRFVCELAADEVTLILPGGPGHLASSLVIMGRRLLNQPKPGWLPVTGDGYRTNLGRRVTRLLQLDTQDQRVPTGGPRWFVKSTLVLLMIVTMVFSSAWLRPQAALAEGGTMMTQFKLSWSRTLAATAVAAILGPLSGDAPADQQLKVQNTQDVKAETQFVMLQERDRERDERRREEMERREREEIEQREREQRERREQEQREREERERHEGGWHPAPEARERAEEMMRREELKNLVHNLQRELEELKRNGQEDAARHTAENLERAKREFSELEARIRESEQRRGRPGPPRPERLPREELERRLHHIRVAADNLHAAGMHDMAEKLMREAEDMKRQLEPREHEQPEMREPPHQPHPQGPIQNLERQMDEMRGEMEEMRRALKELLERGRR